MQNRVLVKNYTWAPRGCT